MAIAKNGIIGTFSGKVGPVVGYELNGQPVMRSVGKRKKKPTPLELLNRARMTAVSKFLTPIKDFVKFGFQREAPRGSKVGAFQLAQSHAFKNAIAYDADNQPYIDPAKVLVAKGPLAPPSNARLERENNRIVLRWDLSGDESPNDRLMIVLYDGVEYRYFRDAGARRKDEQDFLEEDVSDVTDDTIHVYGAFRNTWKDTISDSVYFGTIEP